MSDRLIVVLDIGKTVAKASLWDEAGRLVAREIRENAVIMWEHYQALDTNGIEHWLADKLCQFAQLGCIGAIIPVAHGAAAAIIGPEGLAVPVMDYEAIIPPHIRKDYLAQRDAVQINGSPAMDLGLNLGLQLYFQQRIWPDLFTGETLIVPWAQYWSYRLSGIAVCEISSFGAHTDLWYPALGAPSPMANHLDLASHFAPFAKAGDRVGYISAEWAERCSLPDGVAIHVGIHDSNAALFAARSHPQIGRASATILSTGTWFVAMRSLVAGHAFDIADLPYDRGCLVNIDLDGQPVPTALFMGGRELEVLNAGSQYWIDTPSIQHALISAAHQCIASGAMILPSHKQGIGPFADRHGEWVNRPDDPMQSTAAMALYAALVADAALDLIGAENMLVIDGRFSQAQVFTRALAALRPNTDVFTGGAEVDVSVGTLRLVALGLPAAAPLDRVMTIDWPIEQYRDEWRARLGGNG